MKEETSKHNYIPPAIDWINYKAEGKIGLTGYPGKKMFSDPDSLENDLIFIKKSAALLLTLMEKKELEYLNIHTIGKKAADNRLEWIHEPIENYSVPDKVFMDRWPEYSSYFRNLLKDGENIVIHCWGGLGRTGTVTAMLLTDMGMNPAEAVKLVRQKRPGTIETEEQEAFCLSYNGVK